MRRSAATSWWRDGLIRDLLRRSSAAVFLLALLPAALRAQATTTEISGELGGIHFGSPAIASVAYGAGRQVSPRVPPFEWSRAVFAFVEPGVNAGRLSVGYGDVIEGMLAGRTLRLSALRVWRGDVRNYVGLEASAMIGVQARVGVFVRRGTNEIAPIRITADIGFGW